MAQPTKVKLDRFFNRIEKLVKESISTLTMKQISLFAKDLIVKRTRLGYGVSFSGGRKERLKKLSPRYIDARSNFKGLSETTTPGKSNLTRTGLLLSSVKVINVREGSFVIAPTGSRPRGEPSNERVAFYQAKQGRVFMNISDLEFNQMLRFYRKTFGDLLKKSKLLR